MTYAERIKELETIWKAEKREGAFSSTTKLHLDSMIEARKLTLKEVKQKVRNTPNPISKRRVIGILKEMET